MNRHTTIVMTLFALALALQTALAGDIDLPAPKKSGGASILEAIDARASAVQGDFPGGYLDWNDFSTILWAATGPNRDGSKWTVPMAMGRQPYTKIYLTIDEGSFLYDWKANKLVRVSDRNVKELLPMQDFAKKAPAAMYFVGDGKELARFGQSGMADEFAAVLAGAMSQNVYLACGALGLGARVVYSVDRKGMAEHFKLADGDKPLFAIFLCRK